VTDMSQMFVSCYSLTSLDLSGFDTRSVTNMTDMFALCTGLTSLDLSGFDTRNVTTMMGMFRSCTSLTVVDISNFDTKSVADMGFMFSDCSNLATIYCNSNWDRWVSDSGYMFQGCTRLKGAISYKPYSWDVKYANPDTGYFTRTATAISMSEMPDVALPDAYNLSGQKLTAPKKGVNVIGGKKAVIK